jgi:prepilin-type N-terminal cleavage/methylation domain-containing protein/prepilin-type processing-associated H-X9-DG protein
VSGARRASFTLIELLVVVAIITLLMSILTPSLGRARQQAKSTVCLTRLSEFMKGLTAYAHENQYMLPPLITPMPADDYVEPCQPPPPCEPFLHGWAETLYQYLYRDNDFPTAFNFPVQRNLGGRYELWTCKEGLPLANSSGHYRAYEVSWQKGSLDRLRIEMPLITDANPHVTVCPDRKLSYIPKEHVAGLEGEAYIDERHYGAANYCFNDGHAVRSTSLKEKLAEDWDLDPNTPNQ